MAKKHYFNTHTHHTHTYSPHMSLDIVHNTVLISCHQGLCVELQPEISTGGESITAAYLPVNPKNTLS